MLSNILSRQGNSDRAAFKIIDRMQALGEAKPSRLTEELKLSKSSVHNYLATLQMEGYVVNDGGRYRLGPGFLTPGVALKNTKSTETPIRRTLQSTAGALSQPVWWIAKKLGRGYFLQNPVPNEDTSGYANVENRSYLHTHTLGKAILAISFNAYIEQVAEHHGLPERTRQTTTELDVLLTEIETVRELGFAVIEGEAVLSLLSIGVGFWDSADRRHTIGVFGHSLDFAGNQPEHIGERLVEIVKRLEQTLVEVV